MLNVLITIGVSLLLIEMNTVLIILIYCSTQLTKMETPWKHIQSLCSILEQKAGKIIAPRIFSTGTILYGAKSRATAKINSLKDAQHHLRRLKSVGALSLMMLDFTLNNS